MTTTNWSTLEHQLSLGDCLIVMVAMPALALAMVCQLIGYTVMGTITLAFGVLVVLADQMLGLGSIKAAPPQPSEWVGPCEGCRGSGWFMATSEFFAVCDTCSGSGKAKP